MSNAVDGDDIMHCGLLSPKGSELRKCACRGPKDCTMRSKPGFPEARQATIRDMFARVFSEPSPVGDMFQRVYGKGKR